RPQPPSALHIGRNDRIAGLFESTGAKIATALLGRGRLAPAQRAACRRIERLDETARWRRAVEADSQLVLLHFKKRRIPGIGADIALPERVSVGHVQRVKTAVLRQKESAIGEQGRGL